MAKAKKTESGEAAPKAASKKKSSTPKGSPVAGSPVIDTGLAASVAAKQLIAGLPAAVQSTGIQSNSFKNFKANLTRPAGAGLGGILDKTAAPGMKKPNMPFTPGSKQVGKNQTFGADVNRTGVPRRTGGG